jgi:hypothetical protein
MPPLRRELPPHGCMRRCGAGVTPAPHRTELSVDDRGIPQAQGVSNNAHRGAATRSGKERKQAERRIRYPPCRRIDRAGLSLR